MSTRRVGQWMVECDRFEGFARNAVRVRIMEKRGPHHFAIYGPTGRVFIGDAEQPGATGGDDFVWYVPDGAIEALVSALADRDPASERLTAKLESLLDREAGRVDSMMDAFVTTAIVRTTNEPGAIATPGDSSTH